MVAEFIYPNAEGRPGTSRLPAEVLTTDISASETFIIFTVARTFF